MQEFKSKIEQINICRKCKTKFLSIDGSPCPECSKRNKELAAKRGENKKLKQQSEDQESDKPKADESGADE